MDGYSRNDAADRSGVERGYIDRLIALEIINPGPADRLTKADVRKVLMANALEAAGIVLDDLAVSIRDGHLSLAFMNAPTYERFATLSEETFAELSQRTGLPLDLLMLIRESAGAAIPEPDDRVREDELAVVPMIDAALAMGFRPISIARRLRVLGESLRRVAETETEAYNSDLMEPLLAAGATAADVVEISTSESTLRLDQAMDDAVLAVWHAQQVRSWTADIIATFEKSLSDAGLLTPSPHPPAICFLDISGYTQLTHEQGDAAAADLAEGLGRLVHRTAKEHGGQPVKWLGDGVMVYFRDPGPGVLAALSMVDGVEAAGFPSAHVGLHAGPVLAQEGDYFGGTVNMAARIASYARPREVLVTQAVVDASRDVGATFSEIGPVEFKGIPGAVRLHAAQRATSPPSGEGR